MRTFSVPIRPALYALWVLSYVIYPFWYAGHTIPAQLSLLFFLLVFPAVILWRASFLRASYLTLTLPFPDTGLVITLLPLLLIVTAAHLPFWLLPLPLGGDDQYHAGPPAFFLHKLNSLVSIDILRIAFVLFLGTSFCARRSIKALISRLTTITFLPGFLALAALAAYIYILIHSRIINNAGELTTLVVYAPLSRLLYLAGYFLFGIHETIPYAIQYGFILLTGYALLKTALLLDARLHATMFMLICLLFPTLFYFSNTALLAGGVLFFYAATFYWFLRYLLTGSNNCMAYAMTFITVGMLYKNELLAGWVSIVACSFLLFLTKQWSFSRWVDSVRYAAIPALFFLPYFIITPVWGASNQPLVLGNLLHSQTLFINAINAVHTVGLPLSALMMISTVWTLARYRTSIIVWFLFGFAAIHYIMITATIANTYIRHSQPFYLPFIFFTAFAASRAVKATPRRLGQYALIAGAVLLLGYPITIEKDPLQRINLTNRYVFLFPYPEIMRHLASRAGEGMTIYAPCIGQPSHFYIAKYNLPKTINWVINPLIENAIDTEPATILKRCKQLHADYFFFPESMIFKESNLKQALMGMPRGFTLENELESHGNKAYLFKAAL